jgi:hypothetical protein
MADLLAKYPRLYCCCLPGKPPRFSSIAPITPMMAGGVYLSEEERKSYMAKGWLMDDEGENISCLNPYFGDLTVLYWAWKNANDDYLGVCQYRRPWTDEGLLATEPDILYTPGCAIFGSVEQQYMDSHSIFPAPQLTRDLARRGVIPLSYEMVDSAWKQQKFYGCNMVRGPKLLFDKYCEIVFATIMPLWEENKELCMSITGYQSRSIAFAAERLITAIILNADYFFGTGKVKESPIGFTG